MPLTDWKRLAANRTTPPKSTGLLWEKRMFRVDEREKESIALKTGMLLAYCSFILYQQFPRILVSKRF